MYGYQEELSTSNKKLGLNQNVKMVAFGFINNAGVGGAEAEALEIKFQFEGEDNTVNYRIFPVTKAFYKDGKERKETTDPNHTAFKNELKNVSATITMIMKCFVEEEKLKAMAPAKSFKEYCKILTALLPSNYKDVSLDIFLQYQWKIKANANRTYLEIPSNTKSGRFICKHVSPVGEWKEERNSNGMKYVDDEKNVHPFTRNEQWLTGASAEMQKLDSVDDMSETDSAASTAAPGETSNDW